jgi:hypothetical protein
MDNIGGQSDVNKLIIDAVDEALSTLGEGPKKAIYAYLEANNLPVAEIPLHIEEFSNVLEGLLGAGARLIELSIMKVLHARVGVALEVKAANPWALPELTFKDYVTIVKSYFEPKVETGLMVSDEILEKYR